MSNNIQVDKNNIVLKSVDPFINTANDIENIVGEALHHQGHFNKRTSPREKDYWPENELECFNIKADAVDRVYHIFGRECYYIMFIGSNDGSKTYELSVRVIYNGKFVYANLRAIRKKGKWEGEIYVTLDAHFFWKAMVRAYYEHDKIWEMMNEDGFRMEQLSEFDFHRSSSWRDVPTLGHLCHVKVYYEREKLQELANHQLPTVLAKSVRDYIEVKDTKNHFIKTHLLYG
uniref:Uncharacterized protein n=1 Tax=Metapenaeus ensis majanivirus TaxID=2984279 RepID=A0A9C7CFB6_9VIRU|nr:MAG: hypothetical protein [Metapenaeus ensis majanivirus]